jgi:tripartite-type tricarboxylate transporter receptor subunit TctC
MNASNLPRRQFLRLAAGVTALPAVSRGASAQSYPSRHITMIVPIAAGSGTDVVARVVAERMRAALGQPIVIENVTGADGSIGVGRTARASRMVIRSMSVPSVLMCSTALYIRSHTTC